MPASDPRAFGPIDDFFPPQNYAWPWWVVLPLFIVLLVLWLLLSGRFARMRGWKRRSGPVPAPRDPLPLPVNVRNQAMADISRVEAQVASGELTARDAHIELSGILRELAFFTTRYDARSMTPEELRAVGLSRLADTVSTFYPIAFAPAEAVDASAAIATARGAVSQWS